MEITEIILSTFFKGKVRERLKLLKTGELFFDDNAKELLSYAYKIKDYIIVDSVKNKLIDEYFEKYFIYENLSNPIIKNLMIENLQPFEFYNSKWRQYSSKIDSSWCLTYKDQFCNWWEFKEITGVETYHNMQALFSETFLYYPSYEKSMEIQKEFKIPHIGGGSCADHILHGIEVLKPFVKNALELLNN